MAAVGDALGVNVLRSLYHSRCEWLQWFDVQCEKGCCAGHSISGCSGGNNNNIAGLLCGALQPEHEAAVHDMPHEKDFLCRPCPPKREWLPWLQLGSHLLYSLTSVLRRCLPVEEWLQTLPCRGQHSN